MRLRTPSEPLERRQQNGRIGILFYLFSGALILGVLYLGVPISQARLEDRRHRDIFLIAIAALGIGVGLTAGWSKVWARENRIMNGAAIALPLYALFQIVPLPLGLVALLSPARAELVRALTPLSGNHAFASLSIVPAVTFTHFFLLISYCIIFFSIREFALRARDRVWVMAVPVVLAAAIEAALGVAQFFSGGDVVAHGTFDIRNHFAGLLEMALPFPALYMVQAIGKAPPRGYTDASSTVRICVGGALTALLLCGVLCSLSRGGLASILASTLVTATFFVFRRKVPLASRLATAGLFGVVAAAGLFYVTPLPMTARLSEHTSAGRITLWEQAIGVVGRYPVVGCGLGGFESAFLRFKMGWGLLIGDYAHNDYLQLLAELGVVGFAIGAVLLGGVSIRVMRRAAEASETRWLALGCVASLTAIAVHSFVDFNLYVACNAAVLAWICGLSASLGASMEPAADRVIDARLVHNRAPYA